MEIISAESSAIEKVTDVGVGFGELVFFGLAVWACPIAVSITGEKVKDYVKTMWLTPIPFPSATTGLPIKLAIGHFISTESTLNAVEACTHSGNKAALAVGLTETFYQTYRYVKSNHEKDWGNDMYEGGLRGGAVGAITGFATGGELLGQRVVSAILGFFIGCVMGNSLAGFAHLVRSIHVPKAD